MQTKKLKAGDTVTIVVRTPVATTEEKGIVEMVKHHVIYLKGLEIPFRKSDGQKTDTFPGVKVYIKELQ